MEHRISKHYLDQLLAAPMFAVSLVVLGLFGTLIYLYPTENGPNIVSWCLIALGFLYPVFWVETLVHFLRGSKQLKQHLWFCLLPILRVGGRDHETGTTIWLPTLGWQEIDRSLERELTKFFSIPMILVALSVLPIIIIEVFWDQMISGDNRWRLALQIAYAFIWASFTFEFIVMISVVKHPIRYAVRHWIDLAIILLPMIAFMRAARLTQLFRLNQLAKTARVYRLRGLALRLWRGFVALEFIEKLLSRNPEWRLEKLEALLEEKTHEMDLLNDEIAKLRIRVAEKEKTQNEKAQREINGDHQRAVADEVECDPPHMNASETEEPPVSESTVVDG